MTTYPQGKLPPRPRFKYEQFAAKDLAGMVRALFMNLDDLYKVLGGYPVLGGSVSTLLTGSSSTGTTLPDSLEARATAAFLGAYETSSADAIDAARKATNAQFMGAWG